MKNEAHEVSAILDIDLALGTRDPKQCGEVGE
jgi:hypothetical protein